MRHHAAAVGCALLAGAIALACGRDVPPCEADCVPIPSGEIALAASLDEPEGPGPHPALIAVHGSGKVAREQFGGAGQFWASRGVVFVRYDKRGVGQSEGSYRAVNASNSAEAFDILAGDAVAVADYVAALPNVDASRIGLIGSSQAGWIMPLAASRSDRIAFVVSISGATSSVGLSDHFDGIAERGLTGAEIAEELAGFDGTHGFDPAPVLETLEIPVLWLYGGRDESNPTANDIAIIERIRDARGSDFTVHLFPTGNHQLVDADTGEPFDTFLPIVIWMAEQGILPP